MLTEAPSIVAALTNWNRCTFTQNRVRILFQILVFGTLISRLAGLATLAVSCIYTFIVAAFSAGLSMELDATGIIAACGATVALHRTWRS